jgi:hypothetical protein
MKTAGKLLDNQIVLEGLFTVALYTHISEDTSGKTTYQFVTNRWKKYPAKSPEGMFTETTIPNDLSIVNKYVDDYYA